MHNNKKIKFCFKSHFSFPDLGLAPFIHAAACQSLDIQTEWNRQAGPCSHGVCIPMVEDRR